MFHLPQACVGVNGVAPTLDRRAAVRYHCATEVPCMPIPEMETEPWSAKVQDISTRGIGLLVDRYVEPETLLSVELQCDNSDLPYTVLVQVMNARAHDQSWHLGCAFARDLSEEEVREML